MKTKQIRVNVIDQLRGLVILLMALDHTRDYWALMSFAPADLNETSPEWFFTRWITHFCAPSFVFLSGVSAYLYRHNKQLSTSELAKFLLTRGLWLIVVEIFFISFFWQFGWNFIIAQVIWAIGWSMVILAALIYLPNWVIAIITVTMIFGHNLLDGVDPQIFGSFSWLWKILHVSSFIPIANAPISGIYVTYPLIPWIGVMSLGYLVGQVFTREAAEQQKILLFTGIAITCLFLLLRSINLYGDPGVSPAMATWGPHERGSMFTFLSFLNTSKYPPSLQFLAMTLGPSILLLSQLHRTPKIVAKILTTFGRVPFFFYFIHLPLIHFSSGIWNYSLYQTWSIDVFTTTNQPSSYTASLLTCYLVWLVTLLALYWPCRWFMKYRQNNPSWWISYL